MDPNKQGCTGVHGVRSTTWPPNSRSEINFAMPDQDDDDPLQLKDLAVKYDYLMYKIGDHITNLADLTHQSVVNKRKLIDEDYFDKQLQLDAELDGADQLLEECRELESLFMKLDQLYMFVGDFKTRLSSLESDFNSL